MDKDRNNIIDDMFEYYESNDDLGKTTVIGDDIFAQTRIVDSLDSYLDNADADMGETMQVSVPSRPVPQEETFGNMDRDGKIIEPEPVVYRRRTQAPSYTDVDIPRTRRDTQYSAPRTRPTGLWYRLKPLWVSLLLCVAVFLSFEFYITDTGIVGTYKRNFSYNMTLILRTFGVDLDKPKTDIDEIEEFEEFIENARGAVSDFFTATGLSVTAYAADDSDRPQYDDNYKKIATVPFPGAGEAKFCEYKKGIICAKPNYICYIDRGGELQWEYPTPVSQPILSVAGDYVALAGEDSTQLILYKKGEELYTADAGESIKACSVSPKGDVALVTSKTAYKGAVSVYNSKGEEVFSWISGVNYITSATVTKNRSVAVSLVSTEEDITSYVMLFDIYATDPIGGSEFKNTLIFDTAAYGNMTLAYGDNSLSGVTKDGETKYNILFDSMAITHTAEDENGFRAVSYTDSHLPYLNVYAPKGRLRYSIATEVSPDYIDLYKSTVLYNNGRDIICGKANDSKKTKYIAPMTVKNLVMLNKDTYMVAYENSLEFIKI